MEFTDREIVILEGMLRAAIEAMQTETNMNGEKVVTIREMKDLQRNVVYEGVGRGIFNL